MKNIIVSISVLLLAGCATTTKHEKFLNSWIGENADQLAWVWGPPGGVYTLGNGDRLISYIGSSPCRNDFLVSQKTNTISAWHWQGTDCKTKDTQKGGQPTDGWSRKDVHKP